MEENWYLITSESILINSEPTMLVSESLILTSESVIFVSESSFTQSFFSSSLTYYSGSKLVFDTSSVTITDIIWGVDNHKILFETPTPYTGSYIQSFDSYQSVLQWIYDPNTKEEQYWSSDYEDPDDDPYGIDGPFPEEMDETIV